MRYQVFFAIVLTVVCALPSARADDFVSPEGFTITYPEKWKPATKAELDKTVEITKRMMGRDPGIIGFIAGPASENFAPNVNMIVLKERLVLNPATKDQLVNGIKSGFSAQGVPAPEIKSKELQLDGHKVLSVAYEKDDPVQKKRVRVWQVFFPTKNGTCVTTCTALKSQWAEAGPAFKSIINSLKFDGVPAN